MLGWERIRLAWAVLFGAEILAKLDGDDVARLQVKLRQQHDFTADPRPKWTVEAIPTVWVPAEHHAGGVPWLGIVPVSLPSWPGGGRRVAVLRW